MNIHQTAGWLVAIGLAACVGVSSYIVANEVRAPAAAHAASFPPTGVAMANFAASSFALRAAHDPKATVSISEASMARMAYRAEPLSSTALSLIIPTMRAGETRNGLLTLAGKLTRRNGLLNEEQIKLAAAKGDDASFFQWLSRSVLTNNHLRAAYVGAMAEATAREGAVAALTPVIGPNPAWADFYWGQILRRPASLANAGRLRVAIARAPWRQTGIKETDQALVSALVNRSQFDAAYRLSAGLEDTSAGRGSNLLANADFSHQPLLSPFDWQLAVSGTLGSSIDERAKSLVVSAIGGARGYAARQLVHLTPGNYLLAWVLSSSTPIVPSSLSASIYCAESGVKSIAPTPIPLTTGNKFASIDITEGACRWHWLSINVALADDAAGLDAYFRSISLAPVSGGEVRARSAPAAERTTSADPT